MASELFVRKIKRESFHYQVFNAWNGAAEHQIVRNDPILEIPAEEAIVTVLEPPSADDCHRAGNL